MQTHKPMPQIPESSWTGHGTWGTWHHLMSQLYAMSCVSFKSCHEKINIAMTGLGDESIR